MEAGIVALRLDDEGLVDAEVLVVVELVVWRIVEVTVAKVVMVSVDVDSRAVSVTRYAGDVDFDAIGKKVSVTGEVGIIGSGV
jgi:hypothetical protein